MKSLVLKDIIEVVDGELISGCCDLIINKVKVRAENVKSQTMLFDLDKKNEIDISLFKKSKDVVIITSTPDKFEAIRNNAAIVKVKRVYGAYWKFVYYYRNLFNIPVIGITGTCGKTTTKEMVCHILSSKYKVQATVKSFNGSARNLKYLLGIDDSTGAAVFEMGVASPGELATSCKYFKPQIRVLLNIGVYHLDGCKTPGEYIKAKGEIVEGLYEIDGTLILNADDDNIKKIDISKVRKIIYFGMDAKSDYRATNISYGDKGMDFVINYKWINYKCFVPGYGKHNIYNALAAIASTVEAGIDIKDAIENLKSFEQVIEHLQFHTGIGGCTVIDDTWSSAPPSVEAAINVLRDISKTKKKIAIIGISPLLGDGQYAKEQYLKIGDKVVEAGVDILIVVSEQAKEIGIRALELGMDNNVFFSYNEREVYNIVSKFLNKNTIILLKVTHRQIVEESFIELKRRLIPE